MTIKTMIQIAIQQNLDRYEEDPMAIWRDRAAQAIVASTALTMSYGLLWIFFGA